MKKEIWKTISGYEEIYEISNMGRVRRSCDGYHYKKGEVLSFDFCKGYFRINLHKDNKKKHFGVHILVLENFIGPCPKGMESRHLNGIKIDNCLENLKWGTRKENAQDRIKHGMSGKGRTSPMKGKHHSAKSKKKISIANKGKKRLPEAIKQSWITRREKQLCAVI